ncbi:MAG: hypothetical protein WHT63_09155, partial [Tepidiforma sp.]
MLGSMPFRRGAKRADAEPGPKDAPAEEPAPGPGEAAPRRWLTWRRALAVGVLVMAAAAGLAYLQKDRIAPEVADGLRATIGDERTARVESWFFALEDRVHKVKYRLLGGETTPFAT